MRIGLCLPQLGPDVSLTVVREFAVRAEQAGFDSLWVQDHLLFPHEPRTGYAGRPGLAMPRPYRHLWAPLELLSFVAAITERVQLGTSILVAGHHRPVQLTKSIATIDQLSGGRFSLGLGAGWSEDEHLLAETPFHQRGARADELLAALRACLGPNPVQFEGRWFTIPVSDTSPKPVGRIPLVSGFRSEVGMRRTARDFDVWQPAGMGLDATIEAHGHVNRLAAEQFGRGPLELSWRVFCSPTLSVLANPPEGAYGRPNWTGTGEQIASEVEAARAAGVDEVVIDCNFAEGLGETGWKAVPEELAILAATAHAG